jgi:hypothetical protein
LTAHQFHGKLDYLGRVDLGFLAWQAGRTWFIPHQTNHQLGDNPKMLFECSIVAGRPFNTTNPRMSTTEKSGMLLSFRALDSFTSIQSLSGYNHFNLTCFELFECLKRRRIQTK